MSAKDAAGEEKPDTAVASLLPQETYTYAPENGKKRSATSMRGVMQASDKGRLLSE